MTSSDALTLVGGRVLHGSALRPASVVIASGRIVAVTAADAPRGGGEVVDVDGAIVAPGLVDAHVHGAHGHNLMAATPTAVDVVSEHLARSGTTAFVAATASMPWDAVLASVRASASLLAEPPQPLRAAALGIHLEGPFLSPRRAGVHRVEHLVAPTAERIEALLDAARGALRICTIAPELEGALPAIARLRAAGVLPSFGHTDADLDATRLAIDAGATRATHLWNAMPPLHHRTPGPVLAALADPRVHVELVADGHHVSPDLLAWLLALPSVADRAMLVSDGSDATGLPDGPHRRFEGTEVEIVDGVATAVGGGIAGSTASLLDGVRVLVAAGVPIATALAAASTVPARSLGLHDRGIVEPGAIADLIVLDDDLRLRTVVVRGLPLGI